jgi:hypothetical protein
MPIVTMPRYENLFVLIFGSFSLWPRNGTTHCIFLPAENSAMRFQAVGLR